MFKLPEPKDFFKRVTPVAVPKPDGGYFRGSMIAKFRYMSQEWLDRFTKDQSVDEFIEGSNEDEQVDMLREVLFGFEGIQIGDRVLSDSSKEDYNYLIQTGPYSMYFRISIIQSFFKSVTGARERLSKKGN